MHHAWRVALDIDRITPADKRAGKTLQSYDGHTAITLCCRNPEKLGHIRGTVNVWVQCAGAQVHKYNPL